MEGDKFALNTCQLPSRSTSDRRKITITTNDIVLPDDLLIEILELLPVKSLVRFKCVSKWWYDLISSPRFTNNHLLKGGATTNTNKKMILLIQQHGHDFVFSFRDMDSPELEEIRPNLSNPFLKNFSPYEEFSLLGSHNGIVCFSRNKRPRIDIFLCNPALNQFKQLPPYPLDCRQHSDYSVLGVGFGVTCNNEFKVILIRQIYKPCLVSARVYTSSTNRWKRIHSHLVTTSEDGYPSEYTGHVFFNGACHWDCEDDDNPCRILSFDVNTEVFKHLELPDGLKTDYIYFDHIDLIVLNGCLAFVRHQDSKAGGEVWVMEKYGIKESWNLKFRIEPSFCISRAFLAWKNDECLLLETTYNARLVSICLNDCEITKFEIYGVPLGSLGSVIHEHSLVSLN